MALYSISQDASLFVQEILDKRNQNLELVDVEFIENDNTWLGKFELNPNKNGYAFDSNFIEFEGKVHEKASQGYDLIDVEYGDGGWFGTFGSNNGFQALDNEESIYTLFEKIDQKKQLGYDLIDVEYGDGIWVGVYNYKGRNNVISNRAASPNLNDFENIVKRVTDNLNYSLIDVEYGNGFWVGVFEQSYRLKDSVFISDEDGNQFAQNVGQYRNQGYELIDINYGNGTWVAALEIDFYSQYTEAKLSDTAVSTYAYDSLLTDPNIFF